MKQTTLLTYRLWGIVSGRKLSAVVFKTRRAARDAARKRPAVYGRKFKPVRLTVQAHVNGKL